MIYRLAVACGLTLAGLVALTSLGAPVAAEQRAQAVPEDQRIREYTYNRNDVYQLDTYLRIITSIKVADGETIQSVQLGDSASYEVVRLSRGDVLTIKPTIEDAYSNMTIYTDTRVYSFELRTRQAGPGSVRPSYRVSFDYPGADTGGGGGATTAKGFRLPKDFDYYIAGDAPSIRPQQVYDTGRKTYFVFPPEAPRPAVFAVDAQGRERIVNTRQTGQAIVVPTTSERWTVRIGDRELCIAHGDVIDTVPGADDARRANFGGA